MKGYDGYFLLEYRIDQSMRLDKNHIQRFKNYVYDSAAKFT